MTKLYALASYFSTTAFILCGICFFSPYWLGNIPHSNVPNSKGEYISEDRKNQNIGHNFYTGLWAACAYTCQWFWEDGYRLQNNLFTNSKWYIATQVMYFVGCSLLLFSEITSRFQPCFYEEERRINRAAGFMLLISTILQVASMATFGAGAFIDRKAKSFPIMDIMTGDTDVYFCWTYWLTIPAAACTLIAAVFFLVADCWAGQDKI